MQPKYSYKLFTHILASYSYLICLHSTLLIDVIMSFMAYIFLSTRCGSGSGIVFSCYVSLVSFNLEYFHSLSLPFKDINIQLSLLHINLVGTQNSTVDKAFPSPPFISSFLLSLPPFLLSLLPFLLSCFPLFIIGKNS